MRFQRADTGQIVTLTEAELLGAGGEARIYNVPGDPKVVAKIWHQPTVERAEKVVAMLANPPVDPTASQQHVSIAWPSSLVQTTGSKPRTVGFLMPKVSGMKPALEFFNPKGRRQNCPFFTWFYLHRTARNMATAIRALHDRGYVIGDLNESNVLVAETALVTIVDTDSFQVWDAAKNRRFRCRVGKPEFTPPEMQGKTFSQIDRAPAQDAFGLGVLMFELLMEGTHPFAGTHIGQGEPPPYEARIKSGHFPYAQGVRVPYTPKPIAPPFETLHPVLQSQFIRCFQDGHHNPESRPDPQSWQWALEEAETALVSCWHNDKHVYSGHLQQCPWCARTKLLGGRDPFPSETAVRSGAHLKTIAPPRTPGNAAAVPHPAIPGPPIPPRVAPPVPAQRGLKPRRKITLSHTVPQIPNYAAWTGSILSGASISLLWIWPTFGLLAALGGMFFGFIGVLQAHDWTMDGRGLVQSWIALGLSGISLLCLAFGQQIAHLGLTE